jgi:hypothetical protein
VADPGWRGELRAIAQAQKNVIYVILVRLILIPVYMGIVFGLQDQPGVAQPIVGVIDIVVAIVALIVIYQLAAKVYSPALGVVFAVTQCIPCVGLIMLLVVNGKATTMLQSQGIRVGLMGADMSQLQ